ncbi:hypothetical protein BCR44DRAFT_1431132 [Catenaria anguillulae PL171]|uniref:Piwi domain-containing protein n=1 Tax=Catenaria anguillulae PL171 TaxID=765915 RepID=A0A1Y2HQT8_9FUNG|nr:hypothetical protein BCR44DRAFT_1431132 [Catenaria anguillulae PL171]
MGWCHPLNDNLGGTTSSLPNLSLFKRMPIYAHIALPTQALSTLLFQVVPTLALALLRFSMSRQQPQKFSLGQESYSTAGFVRRPGQGKLGQPIKVVANHYEFSSLGDATIYHYDVATDPEPTKSLARKVWAQFEQDYVPKLKVTCQFKLTFRLVGELAMSDLQLYLQGRTPMSNNILTLHQAIDVMFRQVPSRKMIPAGRSFFDPALPATKLSGGLDLLSGVFMSARMGMGRMTLNVDTAYTAFYRPINVVEFCAQVLGRPVNQLMGQELTPSDHKKIDKPCAWYGVLKLSRTSADKSLFTLNPPAEQAQDEARGPAGSAPGSRQVSVTQYFAETYNLQLRFKNLPCLVVGSSKSRLSSRWKLPPLSPAKSSVANCRPTKHPRSSRLPQRSRSSARTRLPSLLPAWHLTKTSMSSHGISVNRDPMTLDGRILPTPQLDVSSRGPYHLAGCFVVREPAHDGRNAVAGILDGFFNEASRMGLMFNPQEDARLALWKSTGDQFQAYPELFIVVLPRREVGLYAEIKRIGETVLGVPTQCLVQAKIQRANPQYWANVALKVNTKVKGTSFNFHLKQDCGCRGMFRDLLQQYQAFNSGRLPARGQFALVRDAELNASATKLTFILVQKRHHTRFFASNPPGLQGTSRPTRYIVIHDEMNWTADDLQLFTYHQCYTYARCTRSVSVAPAAYYAHLVCFRARVARTFSSDGVPQEVAALHPKLGNSMFFM